MSISFTDVLLREAIAERSDVIIVDLGVESVIEIPRSVDVVAHFVLDGEISVATDQLEVPATLRRGEYGLLLYGSKHRIAVAGSESATQNHVIDKWPVGDEPETLTLGIGKPAAKIISAALRLANSPVSVQSQHPLAELIHLQHGVQPFFMGASLLTDVNQISVACCGAGANGFINALFNLHLTHALRCGYQQMQRTMPLLANAMDVLRSPAIRPIAVAVRLLRMHPERHWTVALIAKELGQSRSSFAAKFRAAVGLGPMEYLNKVRMEKAADLLQSRRDLSLFSIGRQVGYDCANSFARAFKTHFNQPPKIFSDRISGESASSTIMQKAAPP